MLRNIPSATMLDNLATIIRLCQEQGAMVILISIKSGYLDAYDSKAYRALARQMGCVLVPNILDGIAGDASLMSDQIHPNGKGFAKMADKIEPVLRQHLPAPR